MCSKKEYRIVKKIVELLADEGFKTGSRLPSERELSASLESSRNTIRSAVKILVANGVLEVRPGSGYFLVSKSKLDDISETNSEEKDKGRLSEQLEAFFLFEPTAVTLATERMSDDDIKELEDCVVKMSKAFLENDIQKIVSSHKEFHQIIARGTGNRSVRLMLERLEITYILVANVIHKIEQEDRNLIFAKHVNLFKAIKTRDVDAARKMSLQMILSTALLLNKFEDIELPARVSKEIESQVLDMKLSTQSNND